jgi:chromosome partitioning protein
LTHITRNLNGWDDADESGLSVLEWEQDSKAGEDAKALFDELMVLTNEK